MNSFNSFWDELEEHSPEIRQSRQRLKVAIQRLLTHDLPLGMSPESVDFENFLAENPSAEEDLEILTDDVAFAVTRFLTALFSFVSNEAEEALIEELKPLDYRWRNLLLERVNQTQVTQSYRRDLEQLVRKIIYS